MRKSREQGAIIVITAVITTIIIVIIAGLVIFSGYTAADKSQLQNVANLSALAALEEFMENTGAYDSKAQKALAKLRTVAGSSPLKSEDDEVGSIQFGSVSDAAQEGSGRLAFGAWNTAPPDGGGDPCAGNYPCFTQEQNPAANLQKINAARVKLCNIKNDNPLLRPLTGVAQSKCVTATASLANRCIVFLVDTSLSTFQDTHFSEVYKDACPPNQIGQDPCPTAIPERYTNTARMRIEWPRIRLDQPFDPITNRAYSSLPIFQEEAIQRADCSNPRQSLAPRTNPFYKQGLLWCAMGAQRPANGGGSDSRVHYQSDYKQASYRYWNGSAWVSEAIRYDAYKGGGYFAPQPFGNIFLAINVALRTLAQQKSGGDKALLLGFNSNISARIPSSGFASNLNEMILVSNINNRGTIDAAGEAVDPRLLGRSILDFGLLPLYGGEGASNSRNFMQDTNIPLALDVAMDEIKRECAPQSRKAIVLFSDGRSTCARAYDRSGTSPFQATMLGEPIEALRDINYTCGRGAGENIDSPASQYSHYLGAAKQLKGEYSGDQRSILTALQESGISLNTMIAGNSVLPSEYNRAISDGSGGLKFISQSDAAELGLGKSFRNPRDDVKASNFFPDNVYYPGMWERIKLEPTPAGNPPLPDYCPLDDPGACACKNLPRPGFFCGASNRLFGEMALDTGGIHCPLRPMCAATLPSNPTDEDLLSKPPCQLACQSQLNPSQGDCYDANGALEATVRDLLGAFILRDSGYCGGPFYGNVQTCSTIKESKAEQAARCARDVVGGNPYILVEDKIYGGQQTRPTPPPLPGPS